MTEHRLGASRIRELAAALDLHPSKRLGQNFVVDPNSIDRIVTTAGITASDTVLEVGPGLGSLTCGLLDTGAKVIAVEIDHRLAAQLPQTMADLFTAADLQVVRADAAQVATLPGSPTALVANLPYNVAVPVILHCLEQFATVAKGLVLVQAEVAMRLAAQPGTKEYGAPSVKLAWYAQARVAGEISARAFWPVPRVESKLVAFTCVEPPSGVDRDLVFALVDGAFAQRRKMLRSSLHSAFPDVPKAKQAAACVEAELSGTERAEDLAVADYVRLARVWPAAPRR